MRLANMQSPDQSSRSPDTECGDVGTLGGHIKEVIAVISRLEGLGLQSLEIPLPKCVILGEQSSGKSSVIEAISGIQTPRAAGLCTRCPIFIKLERSDCPGWSARVSIRIQYTFVGKSLTGQPFPGWEPKTVSEEIEFARCSTSGKLEDFISRAQLALVYPHQNPLLFAQDRPPHLSDNAGVHFSPNIVCITVASPTLPDLSFYDLPGLIGQSEDADDVEFVRALVTKYVEDEESLVLVTCSLGVDIATSSAGGLARARKATGRCIGILTKPDCLPPGTPDEQTLQVLDGRRFTLGHGYFVVKNPSQADLDKGMSHQDARNAEMRFFSTVEPWMTRLRTFHDRFGTQNLQQFLSEKLAAQMIKKLPDIKSQLQARLDQIEAELAQIPEPPTRDAVRIIADMLQTFTGHVRKEIEAEYPHKDWKNKWEAMQTSFKERLGSMKPVMKTVGARDEGIYSSLLPGNSLDDSIVLDDSEGETAPETSSKRLKLNNGQSTPAKTPRTSGQLFSIPPAPPKKGADQHEIDLQSYRNMRKVFDLDEVASHLSYTSKSKIPDQLQPKVVDDLILITIEGWNRPLTAFLDELSRELKDHLHKIYQDCFGAWKDSPIYNDAWRLVEMFMDVNLSNQRSIAADALNDEFEGPYIFHQEIYKEEKEKMQSLYRQTRFDKRLDLYLRNLKEALNRDLATTERERVKKDERKCEVLRKEPYEFEVNVVVRVTSYYTIASRRFHDSICMRIESKLFQSLRTKLQEDLIDNLAIYRENGFQKGVELLAAPKHRMELRNSLLATREALFEGQKLLEDLELRHGDVSTGSTHLEV